MAGSQSLSPQPVFPSRPRKRFTLHEANRALPLIRRIVTDIVSAHERAADLQVKLNASVSGQEQSNLQEELERTVDKLQDYLDELSDIGAELKDYQMGLVDFIGRHQGRDVYLCWKLGEDSIGYWHELQTGFSGRQPVSLLDER